MNLTEKISMLKNLTAEVGEELCDKLNEVLELAGLAGMDVRDPDEANVRVGEFNYDPDTMEIYITWDNDN